MNDQTLCSLLDAITANQKKPVIKYKTGLNTITYTYADLIEYSQKINAFFKENGVVKGDRIIICGPNSPDWVALFLAAIQSGVVIVPLDFGSSAEFIETVTKETKPSVRFISVAKKIVAQKNDYVLEYLSDIVEGYKPYSAKITLKSNDLFEIIYTSGTTSQPKGVVISHKNIVSNILAVKKLLPNDKEYATLSILPLSHALEQTAGLLIPLLLGSTIVYTVSRRPSLLLETMREENITTIVGVPAFLEMLRNKIIASAPKSMDDLFTDQDTQKMLSRLPFILRSTLFSFVRKQLGNMQICIVGGAALDAKVELFWSNLGVVVMQGYGLTEATTVLTCNSFWKQKRGTVGKSIDGIDIDVLPSGELIAKGDSISAGYYKNAQATQQIMQDGWMKTGDIGEIDSEGYVTIKGRVKSMILSSSGLNVYPEDIEAVLAKEHTIKFVCVVGIEKEGKVSITAVVIPKDKSTFDERLVRDKANKELAPHQHIQEIKIWHANDFPRTSSLKIKRNIVQESIMQQKSIEQTSTDISQDLLLEILKKITGYTKKIEEKHVLQTDLGLDSLGRVELVSRIEEKYGVFVEEADVTEHTTVADLRNSIKHAGRYKPRKYLHFLNTSSLIRPLRTGAQALLFFMLNNIITEMKIDGKENIKRTSTRKPIILIANHTSHLDIPIILKALPSGLRKKVVVAAAKDYFFKNRITGFFVRIILNAFPFSRTTDISHSLKTVGRYLDRGYIVLIMPEGTRSITGKLQPFKDGIGSIVLQTGAQVIPIGINGLYEMLPKGKNIPKKGEVIVSIGQPLTFKKDMTATVVSEQLYTQVKTLATGTNDH